MQIQKPKHGFKYVKTLFDFFEEVPEDWDVRSLGDFAKEINIRFSKDKQGHVLSVTKHKGFVKSLEFFKKQIFSKDIKKYKMVEKGDFAYATIHLEEGSLGLLREFELGYISPMYTVFRIDSSVNPDYLFYLLKTDSYLQKYSAMGIGTVNRRKSISFESFCKLKIPLPVLKEQQKIASILSNVDFLIQQTQKEIEQTQNLKKGLMQKLLIKGIGYIKFKKIKIMPNKEISFPEKWRITTIGNEFNLGAGSTPSMKNPDYYKGSIPWVTSSNLNKGTIHKFTALLTKEAVEKAHLKIYPKGSLIIAAIGVDAKKTRGNCGILGMDATINQTCVGFEKTEKVNMRFFFYFYQLFGNDLIFQFHQGTKQWAFYPYVIRSIKIVLPEIEEQQKIASILSNVDFQIQQKQQYESTLENLKKGLMQKLLTGQIRVKV